MEASGEINGGRSSMVAEKEDDEQLHLKNMIASHPLYGLLIESHFNCLKVGMDEIAGFDKANHEVMKKQIGNSIKPKATTTSTTPTSSELDHFMEAYCIALSKLKEAIEEPTRQTKAFINATYLELKEISTDEPNNLPQEPSHDHVENLEDDDDDST